jgi:hypothetical protein
MKNIILTILIGISLNTFSQIEQKKDSLSHSEKLFESIKIFPNPTSEIIFIRNGELIDSYVLFNKKGEIVQQSRGETQIISLIDLEIGNYFLVIEINSNYKNYRVVKY